jgi:hypothetical protein
MTTGRTESEGCSMLAGTGRARCGSCLRVGDPTRDNYLSQSSVQDRFSGSSRHWRPSLLTDNSPLADNRPALQPLGWGTLRNAAQTPCHNMDSLASPSVSLAPHGQFFALR